MNYYEEFDVLPAASMDEIRQAYRNLARLLHPDNFQDEQLQRTAEFQMKRVNAMFAVLSDPMRRRLYDQETAARAWTGSQGWVTALSWRDRLRRHGGWPAAGLSGAALAVALWMWPAAQAPPPQAKRTEAAAPGPAPQPVRRRDQGEPEQVRQLAAEAKSLRRVLDQTMLERDQALARLAAERTPHAIPVPVAPPPAGLVAPIDPLPPPRVEPASPTDPRPARRIAGTWIYLPQGKALSGDPYVAEYIEMVVAEQDGLLWGRYRARYRVTDRALSPEVQFQFQGRAGSDRYAWSGNGGARGEIQLKLLSEQTVSVEWFTSQLGRTLSLGSGTAVLIRRQETP